MLYSSRYRIIVLTPCSHVKIFDGEFDGYLWPCVAFWCFDRLLRYGRLVYTNVMPRLSKHVTTLASYSPASNMIRIDLTELLPNQKLAPGIFYYIYLPVSLRGWESHPISLCSYKLGVASTPDTPSSPASPGSPIETIPDFKVFNNTARSISSGEHAETKHSFLIRPYDGFTGRLKNKLNRGDGIEAEAETSMPLTVLLEGPYGTAIDLSRHSDVLVLCGGSGIVAAISQAHFLLPTGQTRVHIVWAAPQRAFAEDVYRHEMAALAGHPDLDFVVHLTGQAGNTLKVASDTAEIEQSARLYRVRAGRPDILAVIRERRAGCRKDLAVVSCGPATMADACRAAIVTVLGEEGPHVEFVDESFTW